ncbi:hypothetical protein ACJX0J_036005 [Zea mays]
MLTVIFFRKYLPCMQNFPVLRAIGFACTICVSTCFIELEIQMLEGHIEGWYSLDLNQIIRHTLHSSMCAHTEGSLAQEFKIFQALWIFRDGYSKAAINWLTCVLYALTMYNTEMINDNVFSNSYDNIALLVNCHSGVLEDDQQQGEVAPPLLLGKMKNRINKKSFKSYLISQDGNRYKILYLKLWHNLQKIIDLYTLSSTKLEIYRTKNSDFNAERILCNHTTS